jgi:hypothetical protein
MPRCRFCDYVELDGTNPVREWLDSLSDDDQARIDGRLFTMEGLEIAQWSEKWVSKYKTTELFELRIKGSVQFRPLGVYWGAGRFVILAHAIEKGGKLKRSDVQRAEDRLAKIKSDARHVRPHQFDDPEDLEEDEKEGVS